jgi:hypothetical protein
VDAKLLRYHPVTGNRDLYVVVTDGAFAGQTDSVSSLNAESTVNEPVGTFDQSVLELPRPPKIDRAAKLYVIARSLRAFKQMAVCQATDAAMQSDKAFKALEEAYVDRQYYEFPAGTHPHVVADNDPSFSFVIASDSRGHQGGVSRYALPGYDRA